MTQPTNDPKKIALAIGLCLSICITLGFIVNHFGS